MLIFPSWGHRPFLSVFWYQTHVGKLFFGSSCAYMIHSCCSGNMFSEQICVSGNKVYIFGCVPVCLLNCLSQFHASIPAFMSDVWSQGLPPHCLWAAGGWWGKNVRSRWITSLQWGQQAVAFLWLLQWLVLAENEWRLVLEKIWLTSYLENEQFLFSGTTFASLSKFQSRCYPNYGQTML